MTFISFVTFDAGASGFSNSSFVSPTSLQLKFTLIIYYLCINILHMRCYDIESSFFNLIYLEQKVKDSDSERTIM